MLGRRRSARRRDRRPPCGRRPARRWRPGPPTKRTLLDLQALAAMGRGGRGQVGLAEAVEDAAAACGSGPRTAPGSPRPGRCGSSGSASRNGQRLSKRATSEPTSVSPQVIWPSESRKHVQRRARGDVEAGLDQLVQGAPTGRWPLPARRPSSRANALLAALRRVGAASRSARPRRLPTLKVRTLKCLMSGSLSRILLQQLHVDVEAVGMLAQRRVEQEDGVVGERLRLLDLAGRAGGGHRGRAGHSRPAGR